ncbi:tetratricopeptide repeat protein [Steroidobacter gossypii]|uniref:tetratricopeptide repeat protein n=1 Tax=Steroidobacter gossypii TaxID=2805490 RepID=UPI001C3F60F5|nr:tetratricopeptide repeat protein [Steroidobacter gossypii]
MKAMVVALTCALAGCANPVNRSTAVRYSEAAWTARDAGDWRRAQSNLAKAIPNAQVGGATPRQMSVLYYEYGRASGVICDWEAAEQSLKRALELDQGSNGPVHLAQMELGRMYFDRKDYASAEHYFTSLYQLFERMDAQTADPLGYAVFLDEYAVTLEALSRPAEASPLKARADELRRTFPTGQARTDRTPYGTQCAAS